MAGRTLSRLAPLALGVACKDGGDGGTEDLEPIEDYACVHIAEGTIVDAAPDRESAEEISPGRSPYRVNIVSDEVGYVAFSASGPLTLLADAEGAVPAWWDGETRQELSAGPNPSCTEDLPYLATFTANGAGWLELGPIFQGNVWILLGK